MSFSLTSHTHSFPSFRPFHSHPIPLPFPPHVPFTHIQHSFLPFFSPFHSNPDSFLSLFMSFSLTSLTHSLPPNCNSLTSLTHSFPSSSHFYSLSMSISLKSQTHSFPSLCPFHSFPILIPFPPNVPFTHIPDPFLSLLMSLTLTSMNLSFPSSCPFNSNFRLYPFPHHLTIIHISDSIHWRKKMTRFLDFLWPNLPGTGIGYIIPGQGEFGRWYSGWGREIAEPLFTAYFPSQWPFHSQPRRASFPLQVPINQILESSLSLFMYLSL